MAYNKLEVGKVDAETFLESLETGNKDYVSFLTNGIAFFLISSRLKYKSLDEIENDSSNMILSFSILDWFKTCCFRFINRNESLLKNRDIIEEVLLSSQSSRESIDSVINEIYVRISNVWKTDKIYDVLNGYVSEYEKKKLGGVTTPMVLVKEILDKMTKNKYTIDDKFLDPACGFGPFLYCFKKILMNQGMTEIQAISCLYGVDIDPVKAGVASALIDPDNLCGSRIFNEDFLAKDFKDMKFKKIGGNPPFQDVSDDSTYTNLWSEIYAKSFGLLTDDGEMGLVSPKTWATTKQEDRESQTSYIKQIISNYAISVNIDECARHFTDIGSTFSYAILSKVPKNNVEMIVPGTILNISRNDLKDYLKRLPKDLSLMNLSIFKKVFLKVMFKKEKGTTPKGEMIFDRDKTEKNEKSYPYKVQFSDGTIKWSNTDHRLRVSKKVLFPNQTSRNYPLYDDGESCPPNRGAVYLVQSKEEGENFIKYMKSKLMYFIISQQRFHHGLLNTEVVSNIPKIDLTKSWTDKELYEYFGLNQSEIDYIEESMK